MVAGVAAEEDRPVGEDGSALDGHPETDGIVARHVFAVDDGTGRPTGHTGAKLDAVGAQVRTRRMVLDRTVVVEGEPVGRGADAETAAGIEDHGRRLHAFLYDSVVATAVTDAFAQARVAVGDGGVVVVDASVVVPRGIRRSILDLKGELEEDGRLLLGHEELVPLVAVDGVGVQELAVDQVVVHCTLTPVVVDERGRTQKVGHGNVVGRGMRRLARGVLVQLGQIVVGVAKTRGRVGSRVRTIKEPGAKVDLDDLDVVVVLAKAERHADVAPVGPGCQAADGVGKDTRVAVAVLPPFWYMSHVGTELVDAEQHARGGGRVLLPSGDQMRRFAGTRLGMDVSGHQRSDPVDKDVPRGRQAPSSGQDGMGAIEHRRGNDARRPRAGGNVRPPGLVGDLVPGRVLGEAGAHAAVKHARRQRRRRRRRRWRRGRRWRWQRGKGWWLVVGDPRLGPQHRDHRRIGRRARWRRFGWRRRRRHQVNRLRVAVDVVCASSLRMVGTVVSNRARDPAAGRLRSKPASVPNRAGSTVEAPSVDVVDGGAVKGLLAVMDYTCRVDPAGVAALAVGIRLLDALLVGGRRAHPAGACRALSTVATSKRCLIGQVGQRVATPANGVGVETTVGAELNDTRWLGAGTPPVASFFCNLSIRAGALKERVARFQDYKEGLALVEARIEIGRRRQRRRRRRRQRRRRRRTREVAQPLKGVGANLLSETIAQARAVGPARKIPGMG